MFKWRYSYFTGVPVSAFVTVIVTFLSVAYGSLKSSIFMSIVATLIDTFCVLLMSFKPDDESVTS